MDVPAFRLLADVAVYGCPGFLADVAVYGCPGFSSFSGRCGLWMSRLFIFSRFMDVPAFCGCPGFFFGGCPGFFGFLF
jgi:hypothetical protein